MSATPPKTTQPIESSLFYDILTLVNNSLSSFYDVLYSLCDHSINISLTLLKLMYWGTISYALYTWTSTPSENPKFFLTAVCIALLAGQIGQWSLYKYAILTGIKLPIITLVLVHNLPVKSVSALLSSLI